MNQPLLELIGTGFGIAATVFGPLLLMGNRNETGSIRPFQAANMLSGGREILFPQMLESRKNPWVLRPRTVPQLPSKHGRNMADFADVNDLETIGLAKPLQANCL